MAKLKVAEIFYSLQGEGLYLGTPSIFLRLFGCNFTCAGFGMPRGEKSEERFKVNPFESVVKIGPMQEVEVVSKKQVYAKYEDLPLVHTGCDSYASWDPRFKHLSPMMTVEQIKDRIMDLLPGKAFDLNKHLIITGGEPLLPGWQKVLPELIDLLYERCALTHITFETNGTQHLSEDFFEWLHQGPNRDELEITFSVSSKLPVSGHTMDEAIDPTAVFNYQNVADNIYFKWVVASEEDIDDVKAAIKKYEEGFGEIWGGYDPTLYMDIPVYLMPVGGTAEGYYLNNKRVAEIAMKNGWRYSPRLQVELWRNAWGT
jgi:7-carboxy-7-deazaguanine synthase